LSAGLGFTKGLVFVHIRLNRTSALGWQCNSSDNTQMEFNSMTLTVKIDDALERALRSRCKLLGRSASAFMRDALQALPDASG